MRTLLSNITGFYIFPFPLILRQNFMEIAWSRRKYTHTCLSLAPANT